MKKFFAMLLAVCTCLSVCASLASCSHEHEWDGGKITLQPSAAGDGVKTFTCTSCGETRTEPVAFVADTRIDENAWLPAISELYNGNFRFAMTSGGDERTITVNRDIVKEYSYIGGVAVCEYYVNVDGTSVVYKNEGGVWYKHNDVWDSWSGGVYHGENRLWEDQYKWSTEGVIDDMLPIELLEYTSFVYDEANGEYYCESIEIEYSYGASDYLKDMHIAFENGKLKKITYDFHDNIDGNPVYSVNVSCAEEDICISLGEAESAVSLPNDYSKTEGKTWEILAEFDWQYALVSFQKGGSVHVKGNGRDIVICGGRIKVVEGTHTGYYSEENGKSFTYEYNGEAWVKNADMNGDLGQMTWSERVNIILELYTGDLTGMIFPELYWAYDEFTYDSEKKAYVADTLESDRGDVCYRNVQLFFENGRLMGMSFDLAFGGASYSVELELATVGSVVLPEC